VSAGYSGTPLVRKLGIKAGHRVATVNAPEGFRDLLDDLPPDVVFTDGGITEPLDVIVLFANEMDELERTFPAAAERLKFNGGLWIGWPKKSSPLAGELTGDLVRATGLDAGLVDNKICAIDEDWSGLRFVYRVKDRPKKIP